MSHVRLGVNVDHVATVREARRVGYPDPLEAALLAEEAGADGITVHLREDRRHIQDDDVRRLRDRLATRLNLEMAATSEMTSIARELRPHAACLVPERREELTTEGGLDAAGSKDALRRVVESLEEAGVRTSLFLDPDPRQIEAAAALRPTAVELHTGRWVEKGSRSGDDEHDRLRAAAAALVEAGIAVHAGHGLRDDNVAPICSLPAVEELNIGHFIVARAVIVGISAAVVEMRRAIDAARGG